MAPARRSPHECDRPLLQKVHAPAQGGPLGPRGVASPPRRRGAAAAVLWRLPDSASGADVTTWDSPGSRWEATAAQRSGPPAWRAPTRSRRSRRDTAEPSAARPPSAMAARLWPSSGRGRRLGSRAMRPARSARCCCPTMTTMRAVSSWRLAPAAARGQLVSVSKGVRARVPCQIARCVNTCSRRKSSKEVHALCSLTGWQPSAPSCW